MVTNNSIVQEIHQKPFAGVNQCTSGSEQMRGIDTAIQGMSPDGLIHFIDGLADDINENAARIQAVAFGGRSHADQSENAIYSGMFGAIVGMSESAKNYHLLKDAIAELFSRGASSGPVRLAIKVSKPGQPAALQGAKDALRVAEVGESCIRDNIAPIMDALEALTHIDRMVGDDLSTRILIIRHLAQVGTSVTYNMASTMDCEREAMQDKLNALEGALS